MRSLFGLFEGRTIESPTYPLTSTALLDLLGTAGTDSGVRVTEESSMAMSAVYRAVSLISGLGAALPLPVYLSESQKKVTNLLLEDPHPELTDYDLWRINFCHRLLWGNGYQQKVRDEGRRVRWLYPVSPWRVKVGKAKPTALNPTGKVFAVTKEDGSIEPFTPHDILHIPGLGYDGVCGMSPIRMAAQAIGTGLAAEKSAAKLFGSGNMLSGLLQTEQRLTQEAAETLQARWQAKMQGADRAHSVAVLDSGAQFQSLIMPADDAQMLESRDFEVTEIARFFGVPPYLMFQTERSTSWGTAIEQQATGFVKFDLYPQWLRPVEKRITKELLPGDRYTKYSIEGLLRGDTAARSEFYRVMREVGAFSANDIRELEDMPPIPEGDVYLQPSNMLALDDAGNPQPPPPPPPPPAPKTAKKKPKKTGPKDGDGDGLAPE